MTLRMPAKGLKFMLGVTVNPELVERIDAFRGEVPRSRIVERALNQFLETNNVKNGEGPNGSTRPAQTPPRPPTSTPTTHAGTLEVDRSFETHGTTTEGSRRIGGL